MVTLDHQGPSRADAKHTLLLQHEAATHSESPAHMQATTQRDESQDEEDAGGGDARHHEAACVARILRDYVYPKLQAHQQVLVVPGTFGAKPADPAEDAQLVAKFEAYWEFATRDAKVVGLNPWHYDWDKPAPTSKWLNQFNAGAQQYPQLMAAMVAKGKQNLAIKP